MPKIIIDKELADTLKSMRIERKMQAKTLADKWGKKPPYISKLENGLIKSIEVEDLIKCLQIIVGTDNHDEFIEELLKTVSFKFTKKEIDEMLWIDNFDTVYRRIPIPEGLVTDIVTRMQSHGISVSHLVDQINSNEFISESMREDTKLPYNEWFNSSDRPCIKMKLTYSDVERILNRKSRKANYVTLLAICLYLTRLIEYPQESTYSISFDVYYQMKQQVTSYLESHRIYTLSRKVELIKQAENEEEIHERLSLHDQENIEIIQDAHQALIFYSNYDVATANETIKQFAQNMHWDSPFIMQIAGMPFSELDQCSYHIKRTIIEQIRKILEDTMKIPADERRMERY